MSSAGEPLDSGPPLERSAQLLLLGSIFVVASCGLVYQLVAGAISSYLLGDAVTQFSLVIGVFLCAMGVGSYLSRLIRHRLLATFVEIEIWIGLIGGLSSLAMFAMGAFAEAVFTPFFYGLCALIDEARYHEALVIPAMEAASLSAPPRQVLILGGGDGLAARRVLQYPSVERIVLVDLDPSVTELASSRTELVELNGGALASPKLQLVHQDAMRFLREDQQFYDVVLIDLSDPSSPTLAKLYSRSFYSLVARRLSSHGVLVTQATSPYFARQAFWCIAATLDSAIAADVAAETGPLLTLPFHLHVPSFGEWGFVLASRQAIEPEAMELTVPTQVLTRDALHSLFHFAKDMQRVEVAINQLDDPVLFRYYEKGWGRFNAQ